VNESSVEQSSIIITGISLGIYVTRYAKRSEINEAPLRMGIKIVRLFSDIPALFLK
jgi:hypothetical protein